MNWEENKDWKELLKAIKNKIVADITVDWESLKRLSKSGI